MVNQRHANIRYALQLDRLDSSRQRMKELRRSCLSGRHWQPATCNDKDLLDFQKGG